MLKKIIGTAGTRLIIAIITFVIVIINARVLGSEGVGEIALIVLGVTIILLISNIVGGGAMVYLIPRYNAFLLITPSYAWAFISAAGGTYLLKLTGLIPANFAIHVFLLSLLQALGSINLTFLLGKEKIKQYNIISILQFTILIISVIVFYYILRRTNVLHYIYSLYLAFGTTLALSFFYVYGFVKVTVFKGISQVLKQILKYGTFVQFANLLQLLNYRLSYYIIENYIGKSGLGIFDVGNKMSEGLWLMSKSVSMIQYSKISNIKSRDYAISLTLQFLKFVFTVTFLMLIILLLLPQSFFTLIFGNDFPHLNIVIRAIAPGILAMSLSMIFSHYFSGTGKHYHNTISSGIGLVFTIIFGFTLIPSIGITGAAITASISYTTSMLYQLIAFVIITKTKLKSFIIKKDDIKFIRNELRAILKKEDYQ